VQSRRRRPALRAQLVPQALPRLPAQRARAHRAEAAPP
jgi:hypothetical protein